MNSASLFCTENGLIMEFSLSKGVSNCSPFECLKSSIGGQFSGGALDLINVRLYVKQEIDTWHIIDYAARDDDSLSLRDLLLFDCDLAQKTEKEEELERLLLSMMAHRVCLHCWTYL